jgi:predicted transposase YdaD
MVLVRIRELVRHFPENGMKLMLENPKNVRDLLLLTGAKMVGLIDYDRMKQVQTTFVERDYRHVESDVVLIAPLRQQKGKRPRREVMIYVLIEHQSEPDRLMPLRLSEYVVQIFKWQARAWSRRHRSFADMRFQPVLPVAFYTGTRRWEKIDRLVDLVERGAEFRAVTPILDPLFMNLAAMQPSKLEKGGLFGWVLRLLREREARPEEFKKLVEQVVSQLEGMPDKERLRWLELLSYLLALIYHERDPSEHQLLRETIEASLQTDVHRQEVSRMGRTIADALREEGLKKGIKRGREEGRKEGEIQAGRRTLLRQLRKRFGDLPPETVEIIETMDDIEQLDGWLDQVVSARSLEQMKIGLPK